MNIVNLAEFNDTSSIILNLKNQSPEEKLDINEISMTPKLKRKWRPKGAETTVARIREKKNSLLNQHHMQSSYPKKSASLY